MKRASKGIFTCIIPSFLLLSPVSLGMLVYRYINRNVGDKPARLNKAWAIIYFLFAAFMTLGMIASISKRGEKKDIAVEAKTEAKKAEAEKPKKKERGPGTDITMAFWFIGANVAMGILLLDFDKKVTLLQEDADTMVKLVNQVLVRKVFRCQNCGAENNFEVPGHMHVNCQYCGSSPEVV